MLENFFTKWGRSNFLDHGVLVEDQGPEMEGWFRFVLCEEYDEADPDRPEHNYRLDDILVDINADWIDDEEVQKATGGNRTLSPIGFALCLINTYGADRFYSRMTGPMEFKYDWTHCSRDEIAEYLGELDFDWKTTDLGYLPFDLTEVNLYSPCQVSDLPKNIQNIIQDALKSYILKTETDVSDDKLEKLTKEYMDGQILHLPEEVQEVLNGLTLCGKRTYDLPEIKQEDLDRYDEER